MKTIITIVFLIIFSDLLSAQENDVIKKAKELIADKKYETAFKVLNDFDPKNGNPDIVLLKEDIALNFFVSSIMHQLFSFKDLKKTEDVMDYRGKAGQFGMYKFEIDKVLDSLLRVYPNNCKLQKGLGDYYYEVHLKYGNNWLQKNDNLLNLIELNHKKVIEKGCADYLTYYIMGYMSILNEKYKEGIPSFLKSIEMNSKYASSYYNVAYAYLYIDDKKNALKFAKQSLDLYDDIVYKGDAARMIAQIYSEMKDDNNAIIYYEKADNIDTGNYYNIKPLLYFYVKTNNEKSKEVRKRFFSLAPENPTIYNDLDNIYFNNKSEIIAFYKEQLSGSKANNKVLGNLNFYLGRHYIDIDKKIAKGYFLAAKKFFSKEYAKDHKVFNALEEGLKQTE